MSQNKILHPITAVGVVIPTLGNRPSDLARTIRSLEAAGVGKILIVTADHAFNTVQGIDGVMRDSIRLQPKESRGAAAAINSGLQELIECKDISGLAWIGDDDEICPAGFKNAARVLLQSDAPAAVVGQCRVVDEERNWLLTIRPTPTDVRLLEVKGNKLPQPGSIFSKNALQAVGLLDDRLNFAFDQDLFHRLKRFGQIVAIDDEVANFMWHSGSISGADKNGSRLESFEVRLRHARWWQKPFTYVHYVATEALLFLIAPRLK